MNDACFSLAEQLVSSSYIQQAQQARRARESMVKSLLAQRRMPETGWDEGTLRLLLQEIALMDSNTFVGNAGVGEREARIVCPLVAQRHFGLGHGVGRSGDIAEEQPKAAGSSLLYKLTNNLAQDALRRAGATGVCDALALPLATGMTLTLCLLALRWVESLARTAWSAACGSARLWLQAGSASRAGFAAVCGQPSLARRAPLARPAFMRPERLLG
jgi:O-phospho-L-seryl-tRNASec:L-selenocysteinyl-tRNA synthase